MNSMSSRNNLLYVDIFETIRDRIVFGDYPPGMNLSEKDLCREFNVSRTPLREAIQKLVDLKLVNVIPRFGTHVTAIDINEVRAAFEVKKKLEALAGSLAAKRITEVQLAELKARVKDAGRLLESDGNKGMIDADARFHEIIYEAAQNPILMEFLGNLHSRCARLWGSTLTFVISKAEIVEQLTTVYKAIAARDETRAAAVMEAHVQYFIDKLKDRLL